MIPQTLQQITDSTTIANLQQQVESLTAQFSELSQRMDTTEIGTGYFESIISQQQNLFGILAGLFTLVVLIGIGVSYWWYFRRIESQLSELGEQTNAAVNLVREIPDMKAQLMTTYIDARRALYEGSPPYQHMKVIWHIRYCEAFIKSGHDGYLDHINWHFADPSAVDTIVNEYQHIKSNSQLEFNRFIYYDHIGGIKKILRTVLELAHEPQYKEMRKLVTTILNDIETAPDSPPYHSSGGYPIPSEI